MSITIRKLSLSDIGMIRSFRLGALQESASAFGSSYEDEIERSDEQMTSSLLQDAYWGGFANNGELIAMACTYTNPLRKLAHKAHLFGVYVTPSWRRKGIMQALLEHVIADAWQRHSVLLASVTAGNDAAMRSLEKAGFTAYGREKNAMHDGERYWDLLLYRMDKR